MTENGAAAAAPPPTGTAVDIGTSGNPASPPLPPLPDGVHFAEAHESHVDEIVAHNCAMAKETEDLDLPPAKLHPGVKNAVVHKKARYFVLHEPSTGRVLAQTMITLEWSDWRNADCWWIQSVYVPPDWRRKGLWRALYARVKQAALEEGACGLRLYAERTNERAQSAYTNLGMTSHYVVFEEMFTGY
jgi:GNAT superfamily N-acetyltransferase